MVEVECSQCTKPHNHNQPPSVTSVCTPMRIQCSLIDSNESRAGSCTSQLGVGLSSLCLIYFDSIDGAVSASSLNVISQIHKSKQAASWDSAIYEIKTKWA